MSSRASRALAALYGMVLMLTLGADLFGDSPDWVLDAIASATLDPGELHYVHDAHSSCPFDAEQVERIIEQVLIANDVRPRDLSLWRGLFEQLVLDVSVSCLAREDSSFVYVVDTYLALHSPLDGKRLLIGRRFGRFGVGDRPSILHAIRDSVGGAASAFLAANRTR